MGVMINEDRFGVVAVSINVGSVAAGTSAEQDFTVIGLKPGDFVAVNKPSASAGLGVVNARVKQADTLSITFMNVTDSAIDPAAETYLVYWFRPEKTKSIVQA